MPRRPGADIAAKVRGMNVNGDPIAPRAQMNVNYNKDRQLDSEAGTALTGANKCK